MLQLHVSDYSNMRKPQYHIIDGKEVDLSDFCGPVAEVVMFASRPLGAVPSDALPKGYRSVMLNGSVATYVSIRRMRCGKASLVEAWIGEIRTCDKDDGRRGTAQGESTPTKSNAKTERIRMGGKA